MQSNFDVARRMRAGLTAPAEARDVVLALPLAERARERLALLVSELVTNSLRHAGLGAGDHIDLELASENGVVRVSVRDGGPGFDPVDAIGNGRPTAGFGLTIIAALADEWGIDRDGVSCTVWCALDRDGLAA